jgi:hypothetical protein
MRKDKYQYKCWLVSELARVFPEAEDYWGYEDDANENLEFNELLEDIWESYKYD